MFYKIVVPGPEPGTYLSCHGGSHRWEPDVTYGPVTVDPCRSGFHACRLQDLSTWLTDGMVVFEVSLTGVVESGDKVVGSTATLGQRLGTLTPKGMAEFVRRCAVRAQGYASTAEAARAARALSPKDYDNASYAAVAADFIRSRRAADAAVASTEAARNTRPGFTPGPMTATDIGAAAARAAYAARYADADNNDSARAVRAQAEAASVHERELQGQDILSLLVTP